MFQTLLEVSICFAVVWSSGDWSQIQVVSLNSSFMFIFVQSRLYQENLKALFERSNGEGLKKIANGLVAQICEN